MAKPEGSGKTAGSLRGRLLFALVVPLAILFLVGGAVAYGLAQYFADEVYDGWLFDSVSSLALEVERDADGPFVDMPASTQRLFEWDVIDKTYFRITAEHKGVIAGRPDMPPVSGDTDPYEGVQIGDLLSDLGNELLHRRVQPKGGALIYDGRLDGKDVRVATIDLPAAQFGEKVTVEVAETTRKRRALARAILLSTMVPQLLLIVVALLAIRGAVSRGLRPLSKIARRLRTRSDRELSPIADHEVPYEVRPMTRSLNDLLMRLESALSAQRRFVAEAAHQLRTPLTAIKLQAEEVGNEATMAGARPLIESLRRSTDRAVRLSNQLLSLARAEPDSCTDRAFVRTDLVALVRETGAEWAPRALARDIDMQFSMTAKGAQVFVEGDADLLREAISNLLDNAVKYHPGHGRVHLHVADEPMPTVSIEDDGAGIDAALRGGMLRRFVRGAHGEGSGLGLPIALEIARLHRGDLRLEDATGGRGLRVRLVLPQAADPQI